MTQLTMWPLWCGNNVANASKASGRFMHKAKHLQFPRPIPLVDDNGMLTLFNCDFLLK